MNNKESIKWLSIDDPLPNAIIRTLHTDGNEDVCRVVNGEIWAHDPVTEAPITHYYVLQLM